MPNSVGKSDSQVRKFIREMGYKPDMATVERIGREIRRTESENDRVKALAKELERTTGRPSTIDEKGDAKARAAAHVRAQLAKRKRP